MKFVVKVYDGSKYEKSSNKINEVVYSDVKALEVKTISDKEILEHYDIVDPNKEYCLITFEDNTVSTFRVASIYCGDLKFYQVYRLINSDKTDQSGNREYFGDLEKEKEKAQILADEMNKRRG